jgi:hypothetical protein
MIWAKNKQSAATGCEGLGPVAQQSFQDAGNGIELGQLACGQAPEMLREVLDAALPSLLKKEHTLGGSADVHTACVAGIASDFYKVTALKSGDHATHGGRFDLLSGGEFTESFGTSEDQDREGGQLSWAHSRGSVLLAQPAQQVDCGGMKAVRGRNGYVPRSDIFRLDFGHLNIVSYAN